MLFSSQRTYILTPPPDWAEVSGICLGACIDRENIYDVYKSVDAHTHNDPTDIFYHWICVFKDDIIGEIAEDRTTIIKPSKTLWHEYAHVVTRRGHTEKWRRKMREFGIEIPFINLSKAEKQIQTEKLREELRNTNVICFADTELDLSGLPMEDKEIVIEMLVSFLKRNNFVLSDFTKSI